VDLKMENFNMANWKKVKILGSFFLLNFLLPSADVISDIITAIKYFDLADELNDGNQPTIR